MMKLNILNGDALKDFFKRFKNHDGEDIISFNECLIDGEVHKDIFSEEFFSIRESFLVKNYHVSPEEYKEKSIREIRPLFNKQYKEIDLWFDFDMFCQINMLTILSYLDFIQFEGKVVINIIKQGFFQSNSINEIVEDKVELNVLDHFYDLYVDILIYKDFAKLRSDKYQYNFKNLPYLIEGIQLYINYNNSKSEIKDFILERKNKSRQDILLDLINNLNKYGLGDVQYMKILDEMGIQS